MYEQQTGVPECGGRAISVRLQMRWRSLISVVVTVGAAIILSGVPRDMARASTLAPTQSYTVMASTIYLYNDDLEPVEDPTAYIQEGDVYDLTGFVGTANGDENILGTDGTTVIGYVLTDGPGGPGDP